MKIKTVLLILVCILPMTLQANGVEYKSGNELLVDCTNKNVGRYGICLGYLISVNDTHNTLAGLKYIKAEICIPSGVTVKQLKQLFLNFANYQPQYLNNNASSIIFAIYRKEFPCK